MGSEMSDVCINTALPPELVSATLQLLPWIERHRVRAVCQLWRVLLDRASSARRAPPFQGRSVEEIPTLYTNLLLSLRNVGRPNCSLLHEAEDFFDSDLYRDVVLFGVKERPFLIDLRPYRGRFQVRIWSPDPYPFGTKWHLKALPIGRPLAAIASVQAAMPSLLFGKEGSQQVVVISVEGQRRCSHNCMGVPLTASGLSNGFVALGGSNFIEVGYLEADVWKTIAHREAELNTLKPVIGSKEPLFITARDITDEVACLAEISLFDCRKGERLLDSPIQLILSLEGDESFSFDAISWNETPYLVRITTAKRVEVYPFEQSLSADPPSPEWSYEFEGPPIEVNRISAISLGDVCLLNLMGSRAGEGSIVRLLLAKGEAPLLFSQNEIDFREEAMPIGTATLKGQVVEFWSARLSSVKAENPPQFHLLAVDHLHMRSPSSIGARLMLVAAISFTIAVYIQTIRSVRGNWRLRVGPVLHPWNLGFMGGSLTGLMWGDVNGEIEVGTPSKKAGFVAWIAGFSLLNGWIAWKLMREKPLAITKMTAVGLFTSACGFGASGTLITLWLNQPTFHPR